MGVEKAFTENFFCKNWGKEIRTLTWVMKCVFVPTLVHDSRLEPFVGARIRGAESLKIIFKNNFIPPFPVLYLEVKFNFHSRRRLVVVLAPRSAHVRPSAQPSINMKEIFQCMCLQNHLQTSGDQSGVPSINWGFLSFFLSSINHL